MPDFTIFTRLDNADYAGQMVFSFLLQFYSTIVDIEYWQQFQLKVKQHFLFCLLLFFSHLNPLKQLPANNVLTQFGADCPVLAGESERMSIYNQICFEVPLSHNATVIFVLDSMKKMKFGWFCTYCQKKLGKYRVFLPNQT